MPRATAGRGGGTGRRTGQGVFTRNLVEACGEGRVHLLYGNGGLSEHGDVVHIRGHNPSIVYKVTARRIPAEAPVAVAVSDSDDVPQAVKRVVGGDRRQQTWRTNAVRPSATRCAMAHELREGVAQGRTRRTGTIQGLRRF